MLLRLLTPLTLAATCTVAGPALAQSRGELLYATHCLACHNDQLHWRDKRQAVDWPSLLAQVRQWQAAGALGWSEDDIVQVTRHLNNVYYRFVSPLPPQARLERHAFP